MAARPTSASAPTAKDGRLGFIDGVGAFFGGVRFVVGQPSMWGWALVPTLVATALFLGLGAVALWGGTDLALRLVTNDGGWRTVGFWALRVLFWVAGVIVAFFVAISLAQPLSGYALETIARRQEVALGGRSWPNPPFIASAIRSLWVSLTALAVTLPLLALLSLVTFFLPPASVVTVPLKLFLTGLAMVYDFLDYPLSLRGAGIRSRWGFVRAHFPAVIGFALSTSLLLLIPGLGLALLPLGVAGAARMVVAADRIRSSRDGRR